MIRTRTITTFVVGTALALAVVVGLAPTTGRPAPTAPDRVAPTTIDLGASAPADATR